MLNLERHYDKLRVTRWMRIILKITQQINRLNTAFIISIDCLYYGLAPFFQALK